MCTKVMVCHGDRVKVFSENYSDKAQDLMRKDSQPARYFITRDGKYAVDADYVSAADLESDDLDLTNVPKIPLNQVT